MIKIRALKPGELKQVLHLLKRYSSEEEQYAVLRKWQQLYIPMQRLSQLLPLKWQFMPAIFVAVSRDRVLGLIWLSMDGKHVRRWKIDQLILDPDAFSYDLGTQLVNYVINRYGGEGVQTFLAYVDHAYATAIDLLKSCGFRKTARLHSFVKQATGPSNMGRVPGTLRGLRESGNADSRHLKVLYNDSLPAEVRGSLKRNSRDFFQTVPEQIANRLQGVFYKRWVVDDVARDALTGSIEMTTTDYRNFFLKIVVHPGWEHTYEDLLAFGIQHALHSTGNAQIHVECFEFRKQIMEALENSGFKIASSAEVLVKDYWIPIEDKGDRLRSPILLFSGKPSPAINCR